MKANCPVCPLVLLKKNIPVHLRRKHPQAFNEYMKKKKEGKLNDISWYGMKRRGWGRTGTGFTSPEEDSDQEVGKIG